jgi:UDP-N-acetylglucosamine--N-acetylmuramyl-(pentapeptide) pyrophosphoryl-undecaprenol N-acetylglucosamine transferase
MRLGVKNLGANAKMRIIMSGGGTGGHVNPAIAIANILKEREEGAVISFVGTSRGIENKLVKAAGYPLDHIEIQGLRRSLSLSNIKTAFLLISSAFKAKKLLREQKPDLVVGTGGYACYPICNAAAKMGIPTVLHESNAIPGVAVRMLQNKVDRIYVNFEQTISRLKVPEKAYRVGNPLRGGFSDITHDEARKALGLEGKYRFMILSCGGSMGAEPVNDAVLELMRDFSSKHPDVLHVHATGALEYKAARAKFEEMGLDKCPNLEFLEYIYDMPQRMAAADVVINRAGAMTLSELAAQKKPCILIPSPYVTDNHQYKNAHALEVKGAAIVIEEKNLALGSSEGCALTREVAALLDDRERMRKMGEAIADFALLDCADRLYDDLLKNVLKK